jgi:hypothetical protein
VENPAPFGGKNASKLESSSSTKELKVVENLGRRPDNISSSSSYSAHGSSGLKALLHGFLPGEYFDIGLGLGFHDELAPGFLASPVFVLDAFLVEPVGIK